MKKGYKRFSLIADIHNHLKFCLIKVLTFYRDTDVCSEER